MTKSQKPADVSLGFEVGSGREVRLPIRHLAITGQTQEAGKTTALEGLITRSGLRAVTFVTKRGEGSFTGARRIEPYFREQADWQFVASLLEASRGERMKMERAFIIRASKGARTLADVHSNVKASMADPKVRGLAADMYLCLDAYLEVVVPEISRVRWASGLELAAGVNAVDLTHVPVEMQHLVIKSSIDWVLAKEENTVVVIPEAWKFLPQGRGTPVKHAADALIRQGAGLRNYVWLDSQDIGGIEKGILRHVPVWILGVQREANEIKRTLDNIPEGIAKPSKAAVATLQLGEFFACWSTHAIKTYAQPTWLPVKDAAMVARGELDARMLSTLRPVIEPYAHRFSETTTVEEKTVTDAEAQALRSENARLTDELATLKVNHSSLKLRLEALEGRAHHDERPHVDQGRPQPTRRPAHDERQAEPAPGRRDQPTDRTDRKVSAIPATINAFGEGDFQNRDEERYQAFKARLIAELPSEPRLLQIVSAVPELSVKRETHTIVADGETLRGRLGLLLSEGFFDTPRGPGAVISELQRRGAGADVKFNCSKELQSLNTLGFLVRDGVTSGTTYQAVEGMKVNIVEAS